MRHNTNRTIASGPTRKIADTAVMENWEKKTVDWLPLLSKKGPSGARVSGLGEHAFSFSATTLSAPRIITSGPTREIADTAVMENWEKRTVDWLPLLSKVPQNSFVGKAEAISRLLGVNSLPQHWDSSRDPFATIDKGDKRLAAALRGHFAPYAMKATDEQVIEAAKHVCVTYLNKPNINSSQLTEILSYQLGFGKPERDIGPESPVQVNTTERIAKIFAAVAGVAERTIRQLADSPENVADLNGLKILLANRHNFARSEYYKSLRALFGPKAEFMLEPQLDQLTERATKHKT